MHYYKRNIGDYSKKCGRLSMLEHGAYTLLLDACYDREQFPTREQAIEWSWARTKEEMDAVDFVLSRFFDLVDGVYVQKRIQEELETYQSNSETNRRIATEREKKRKERVRSVNESHKNTYEAPPNQEPLTINQEPLTINQEPITKNTRAALFILPDWIPQEIWAAFLETREKKKAANTDFAHGLVLKTLAAFRDRGFDPVEVLENSIRSGWSDVYEPKNKAGNRTTSKITESYQERASRVAAERMAEFAPGVARKISRFDAEIVDDAGVGNVIAIEGD